MKRLFFLFGLIIFCYSVASAQLTDIKICIDPGHGGFNSNDRHVIPDPGTDFWESESNFRIALFLKQLLEEKGAWVILTRYSNDTTGNYNNSDPDEPSLTARWQIANTNNVNWFHSIHSNATGGTNTSTNYTLLLVKEDIPTRQPSFPAAVTMSNFIGPQMKAHNRTSSTITSLDYTFYGGTNGGYNLGVLSGLTMPGELSEGSFHDYYPETRRLMSQDYRKVDAYGIRDGFMQYFNQPADSFSIVAGIQKDKTTGAPQNGAHIRLLPENLLFVTDNYNNGYYKFDNLAPGYKTVVFESVNGNTIRLNVNVTPSGLFFVDLKPEYFVPPYVTDSQPANNDTAFAPNNFVGMLFSANMDTASVRQAFSITPGVSGTLSWASLATVMFTPSGNLPANTDFTVIITDSAKSAFGVKLNGNNDTIPGGNYILKFRTASLTNINDKKTLVNDYSLSQNYPNPFNPSTKIDYHLRFDANVRIELFNITGQKIADLVNANQSAGFHSVNVGVNTFKNIASGIYIYKMTAIERVSGKYFVSSKKLILLK